MSTRKLKLDARGFRCPKPLMMMQHAIRERPQGAVLEVLSDDPVFESNVRAWCKQLGHTILSLEKEGEVWSLKLRKGS
ncbi:MAG: sulfurtransferase TusA family protein [Armatimonadetes bacterium]|nr:sulfurtransferase TusA family protein [Armatimonadota bacterium]